MCVCSCCIIYERLVTLLILLFILHRALDFFFPYSLSLSVSPSLFLIQWRVLYSPSSRGDTFGKVKGRWRVACSMSRKLSYWVGCRSNRDLKRRILLTWRENFSGQNVRSLTSSECLIFLFFFSCARWSCFRYKQD